MIIPWLHRRREAARLANAETEALIRDHGGAAYWEARRRGRDVILPDGPVAFADADFGNCALLNPGLLRSFERAAPRHMERQSCALASSDSWPRWGLE